MRTQPVRLAAAAVIVMIGGEARGALLTGSLTGSLTTQDVNVNLTTEGTKDWAIWGFANGGASTSLGPDVRKSGGSAISNLTDINPPPSLALRGIGQFSVPFRFSWTDGNTVSAASSVSAGLQNFSPGVPFVAPDGYGFSLAVPASPIPETLRVYVSAHHMSGRLLASLSDNSAPAYIDTGLTGGFNAPGFYTINYAAASEGQNLDVQWTQFSANGDSGNVAVYAVTLGPEPSSLILLAIGGLAVGGVAVARRRVQQNWPSFQRFAFCLAFSVPIFVSHTMFAGILYVSNGQNGSVTEMNSTGIVLQTITFFNPQGLSFPDGLALDPSGNLFIADDGTHSIRKIAPDGSMSTIASGFGDPLGMAIDRQRNLFVSDGATGQIYKVTQGGSVSTFVTSLALHDPSESAGLAFDANGNLYDAAPPVNTVFKITPSGGVSKFASGLDSPEGLAFDGSGNLYVSSFTDGTITRIDPNGTNSVIATGLDQPANLPGRGHCS